MTLQRRARLARKTRLRRTPLKPAARRLTRPRCDTGPTAATRQLVWERAGGRCEICGFAATMAGIGYSIHHRLPRRMGGSRAPWINSPANLLLVCGSGTVGCHGMVEANRANAYGYGWLLKAGQHPAEVSAVLGSPRRLVWLTNEGTYATRPAA
jgi:hypothetical protein